MKVTKNLGKLNQYVAEKIGHAKGTQTAEDIRRLEHEIEMRKEGFEKMYSATEVYMRQLDKRKESVEDNKIKVFPVETLGTCMIMYGECLPEDSKFGQSLRKAGQTHEKIGHAQHEYVNRAQNTFCAALERTHDDMKDYINLKKKLESRRLDYDSKQSKVQKAKRENHTLENEMQASKNKYEETEDALRTRMASMLEAEDDHYRDLIDFVRAEAEYFRSCAELCDNLLNDFSETETPSLSRDSRRAASESAALSSRSPARSPIIANRRTPSYSSPHIKPSDRLSRDQDNASDFDQDNQNDDYFNYQNSERSSASARRVPSPIRGGPSTTSRQSSTDTLSVPRAVPIPRNETYNSPRSSMARGDDEPARSLSPASSSSRRTPPVPAPKKKPSAPPRKMMKALYEFVGEGDGELSFGPDDIITVTEEIDEGWWNGEIVDSDGVARRGMFPVNYTEEVTFTAPPMPARPPVSRTPTGPSINYSDEPDDSEYPEDQSGSGSPFADSRRAAPARSPASNSPIPRVASSSSSSRGAPKGPAYLGAIATAPAQVEPMDACKECGCEEYQPNVFKKGQCNNCFHTH